MISDRIICCATRCWDWRTVVSFRFTEPYFRHAVLISGLISPDISFLDLASIMIALHLFPKEGEWIHLSSCKAKPSSRSEIFARRVRIDVTLIVDANKAICIVRLIFQGVIHDHVALPWENRCPSAGRDEPHDESVARIRVFAIDRCEPWERLRIVDHGGLSEHSGGPWTVLRLSEGQFSAGELHRGDEIRPSTFLQEIGEWRLSFHRGAFRRGAVYFSVRFFLPYYFVPSDWHQVSQRSEEILHLPIEELRPLVGADELNVKSEQTVWELVLRWINYNPDSRKEHIVDLMKNIRLGLLDTQFFLENVKDHPYVVGNDACRPIIIETLKFLYDLEMITQKDGEVPTPEIARPRVPHEILFAIGGWSGGSPTNYIETYDTRADRWIPVVLKTFYSQTSCSP